MHNANKKYVDLLAYYYCEKYEHNTVKLYDLCSLRNQKDG
jgi:hypothetical protein